MAVNETVIQFLKAAKSLADQGMSKEAIDAILLEMNLVRLMSCFKHK